MHAAMMTNTISSLYKSRDVSVIGPTGPIFQVVKYLNATDNARIPHTARGIWGETGIRVYKKGKHLRNEQYLQTTKVKNASLIWFRSLGQPDQFPVRLFFNK